MKKRIISLLSIVVLIAAIATVQSLKAEYTEEKTYSKKYDRNGNEVRKKRTERKYSRRNRDNDDDRIYRGENYEGKGPVRATGTAVGDTVRGVTEVPRKLFGRDRDGQETVYEQETVTYD